MFTYEKIVSLTFDTEYNIGKIWNLKLIVGRIKCSQTLTGAGSPGKWPQLQACQSSGNVWMMLLVKSLVAGSPVRSSGVALDDPYGLLQVWGICDSVGIALFRSWNWYWAMSKAPFKRFDLRKFDLRIKNYRSLNVFSLYWVRVMGIQLQVKNTCVGH